MKSAKAIEQRLKETAESKEMAVRAAEHHLKRGSWLHVKEFAAVVIETEREIDLLRWVLDAQQ